MAGKPAVPKPRGAKQWIVALVAVTGSLCLCSLIGASLLAPSPPAPESQDPQVVTRIVEVTRIVSEPAATPTPDPAASAPEPTATPAPAVTVAPATATPQPATPVASATPGSRSISATPSAALSAPPPAPIPALLDGLQTGLVLSATDGDTIRVSLDGVADTIRYIGIDAPEDNSAIGQQASEANRRLVEGQTIYLQPDITDRDQYDRLLRYVYLPDGRMVNQELVAAGHALSVAYPPDTTHQADFDAAQQQAQAARAGLWQTIAWASGNANIRSGPGTAYPVVDSAQPGRALDISGRNDAGDWLKLATGGWVFANLVANAPSDLPIAPAPATVTPVPQRAAPAVPLATATSPAAAPPASVCTCSGIDYDCGDFSSWSAAQGCFNYCLQTVGYDVHRLDQDNDGIACESMR